MSGWHRSEGAGGQTREIMMVKALTWIRDQEDGWGLDANEGPCKAGGLRN